MSASKNTKTKQKVPQRRPYKAPAVQDEELYERHAIQACGGKDGSCGPFITS